MHAFARRERSVRLLACAVVLQLMAGLVAAVVVDERPSPAAPAVGRARTAVPEDPEQRRAGAERAAALARADEVGRLLAARSAAVLARDRAAFLATVDPVPGPFLDRQAALFDALAEVPLGTWEYVLVNPLGGRAADPALDARYGRDAWWAPNVTLRYSLAEFDAAPTNDRHHVTFVRRDGRWLLGADDDFEASGGVTQRALWDSGPVTVVGSGGALVLGHGDAGLLRQIAATTATAIPAVSAVWTDPWLQKVVVLVPSSSQELSSLLGSEQDLSKIAALATSRPGPDGAVTDRVLVNPQNFLSLGTLGRRIVLTHEVTHVATRSATGAVIPAWLAEGLADYVAYKRSGVPVPVAAADLRADVQAGRLPAALPTDQDFAGGNASLAQAYQQSWLAVRLLVDRFGEPAVVAAYRSIGAQPPGQDRSAVVSAELQKALGIDTARLTEDWRASLKRQLG